MHSLAFSICLLSLSFALEVVHGAYKSMNIGEPRKVSHLKASTAYVLSQTEEGVHFPRPLPQARRASGRCFDTSLYHIIYPSLTKSWDAQDAAR